MNPEELISQMQNCATMMEDTAMGMMFFADLSESFEQNASILFHMAQALGRFAESCSMSLESNTNGTMTVH